MAHALTFSDDVLAHDIIALGKAGLCEAIVNPVNALGISGAGLAKLFAREFPANDAHLRECVRHATARMLASNEVVVFAPPKKGDPPPGLIFNVITKMCLQEVSTLDIIAQSCSALARLCVSMCVRSVAIPRLGCGLGGLQWSEVRPLVEWCFTQAFKRARDDMRVVFVSTRGDLACEAQEEKKGEE